MIATVITYLCISSINQQYPINNHCSIIDHFENKEHWPITDHCLIINDHCQINDHYEKKGFYPITNHCQINEHYINRGINS